MSARVRIPHALSKGRCPSGLRRVFKQLLVVIALIAQSEEHPTVNRKVERSKLSRSVFVVETCAEERIINT